MILLKNTRSIIKVAFTVAMVSMLGLLAGCNDDDSSGPAVTEVDRVFSLLSASGWQVSEVTVGDLDFSSTYSGLSLSFSEGTYTSVNGGPIFPSPGTWNFTDSSAEKISFNGDVEVDVLEISESILVLGLTWNENTIGTGRTESVSGEHIFTFGK